MKKHLLAVLFALTTIFCLMCPLSASAYDYVGNEYEIFRPISEFPNSYHSVTWSQLKPGFTDYAYENYFKNRGSAAKSDGKMFGFIFTTQPGVEYCLVFLFPSGTTSINIGLSNDGRVSFAGYLESVEYRNGVITDSFPNNRWVGEDRLLYATLPLEYFLGSDIGTKKIFYETNLDSFTINGSSVAFKPQFRGEFGLNSNKSTLDFTFNITDPSDLKSLDNGISFTFFDSDGNAVWSPSSFLSHSVGAGTQIVDSELYWQYIGDLDDNVYTWSLDTLKSAGLKSGNSYTVKAYCHMGAAGTLYSFSEFTFEITDNGIRKVFAVDVSKGIGAWVEGHDRVYIGDDGKAYDLDTGQAFDDVYGYDFYTASFDDPTDIDIEVSDFSFAELPASLTQGTGFVRWLFDKLLEASGLSGFVVVCVSLAVASWFIFGRML